MERFNCSGLNAAFNIAGPNYILFEEIDYILEKRVLPASVKKGCEVKSTKKNEIQSITKNNNKIIYTKNQNNEYKKFLDSHIKDFIDKAQKEQYKIMLENDIEYIDCFFKKIEEDQQKQEKIIIKEHSLSTNKKYKVTNWTI